MGYEYEFTGSLTFEVGRESAAARAIESNAVESDLPELLEELFRPDTMQGPLRSDDGNPAQTYALEGCA